MGRRSKDMITMTAGEVEAAKERLVEDKLVYLVEVSNQKSAKSGKIAHDVFTKEEFDVLSIFIRKLRPRLVIKPLQKVVFPSTKTNESDHQDLSLSDAWKILQNFETESGKKVTSRSYQ